MAWIYYEHLTDHCSLHGFLLFYSSNVRLQTGFKFIFFMGISQYFTLTLMAVNMCCRNSSVFPWRVFTLLRWFSCCFLWFTNTVCVENATSDIDFKLRTGANIENFFCLLLWIQIKNNIDVYTVKSPLKNCLEERPPLYYDHIHSRQVYFTFQMDNWTTSLLRPLFSRTTIGLIIKVLL